MLFCLALGPASAWSGSVHGLSSESDSEHFVEECCLRLCGGGVGCGVQCMVECMMLVCGGGGAIAKGGTGGGVRVCAGKGGRWGVGTSILGARLGGVSVWVGSVPLRVCAWGEEGGKHDVCSIRAHSSLNKSANSASASASRSTPGAAAGGAARDSDLGAPEGAGAVAA